MHKIFFPLFLLTTSTVALATYCPFCDRAVIERQAFYEDDLVLALYDHKPIFPGHSLIIPKRHVERFEQLTEEEITQIGRAIKKTNSLISKVFDTSAYLIAEKNGREVGQSVPHIHFHYIPRKSGDDSILYFLWSSCLAHFKKQISPTDMKEITDFLKSANTDLLQPVEKKM